MKELKKAIIGVITLAITTVGGLLINKYMGGEEEEKSEVITPAQPTVIVNVPQQSTQKDTVVKKVYVKPIAKKTKTEKRKEEIDW